MFIEGSHFKFDSEGYHYLYKEELTTDEVYDFNEALNQDFPTRVVTYTWKSAAWHFGTASARKWVTQARCWLKNLSDNLTMQLTSFNDDKQWDPRRMKPVTLTNKTDGFHIFKRWFPARTLRCMYKQLQISNHDTIVIAQSAGATDVARVMITATKDLVRYVGGVPTAWPDDLAGQHIYLASDNYQDPFLITNHTNGSNSVRVRDEGEQIPADTTEHEWVIRGQNTGERFQLEMLEVPYVVLGESIDADPEA